MFVNKKKKSFENEIAQLHQSIDKMLPARELFNSMTGTDWQKIYGLNQIHNSFPIQDIPELVAFKNIGAITAGDIEKMMTFNNSYLMPSIPKLPLVDTYIKNLKPLSQGIPLTELLPHINKNIALMNEKLEVFDNIAERSIDQIFNSQVANYFNSYKNLNQSFLSNLDIIPQNFEKLPLLHSQEALTTSDITLKLYNKQNANVSKQDQSEITINEISLTADVEFQDLLIEVNPHLFHRKWIGAEQALASNNIDKISQISTSLREIITRILHYLAPDEKIKNWSNEEELYDKGKLTRRARLLYITRAISDKNLKRISIDYYENDINIVLKFIDYLNKLTHQVESGVTESELRSILLRTKLLIISLIETAKISNREMK
jgi:hypothetical protein